MIVELLKKQHAVCFNSAKNVKPDFLSAIRKKIDLLLEKGASLSEAKTALCIPDKDPKGILQGKQ